MFQKVTLPNGLRIVTEEIPFVRSVAIGIWIGAGSRDEQEGYEGISHFIEHMLFKGTTQRTAKDLAESLETAGGQLNAFTTKEYTCYYAKVLDEDVDLAIDVLGDMFFCSLFDEQEIEKEKRVVIEEVKMYEDTPDELIHDLFSEYVWNDHPLGRSVLGTAETIHTLTREKILTYMDTHYGPENIVVAVAGKITHAEIIAKLGLFSEFRRGQKRALGVPPVGKTICRLIKKDTEQMHLVMGVPGLGQNDDDIYAMHIINNILGGGLSSRLFQQIREQRGLAYTVYTYHSAYADAGLFAIYAGASPVNAAEVVECILSEMDDIRNHGISPLELERTKSQIKGSLYLGLEAVSSRMSRLGKTELTYNRVLTPEEVVDKLTAVALEDIIRVMRRLWQREQVSLAMIGPAEFEVDLQPVLAKRHWG
ncbi:MAG: insulinase family protein [Peptococcaceae bacterium]|nr:insulinase family protein [Peptococcaceae bacterium]